LRSPYIVTVGEALLVPGGKMPVPRLSPGAVVQAAPTAGQEHEAQAAEPSAPDQAADTAQPAPANEPVQAAVVEAKPLPYPSSATESQAAFILGIAEPARVSQRETGVPASVTIAQAILESYWGSSRLAREANNFFGIKARERGGSAGVVWFNVWEHIGGRDVVQNQPFRAYQDLTDSFVDHGLFFVQNGRYATAMANAHDPRAFAQHIGAAGYATDPGYAAKLIGLMDRFNLYAYDI
jgi:flagellum-specific peptidoglycan hydrolase FlgJ